MQTEQQMDCKQIDAIQKDMATIQCTLAATAKDKDDDPMNSSPLPSTPSPTKPVITPTPPPAAPISMPAIIKRKPTLLDPPRFNGDRRKFRTWLLEIKGKLYTDGAAIGSSTDQFTYIYSCLD